VKTKELGLSGKNKILQAGEILFRVGDKPTGMFIIRRGQILVFLDKGGQEIPLATIGAGGMIGEMSLFDKKPRSASARAVDEVEITQISNEEFAKILQQIPKWFVSLMTTLSTRLRDTNDRLQDLESKYKGNVNPLEELTKTLHIIQLLWHKLGIKEAKNWIIEREVAEKEAAAILNIEISKVSQTIQAIISGGLISSGRNTYKKETLGIVNRGDLERFIYFVTAIRRKNMSLKFLPQEFVDIAEMLAKQAKATAYDSFSIELKNLEVEAKSRGFRTDTWLEVAPLFVDLDSSVIVSRTGKDISFKIQKKGIDTLIQHAKILRVVTRSEEKKVTPAA
jgi:CRP-like cAMP-binding protein